VNDNQKRYADEAAAILAKILREVSKPDFHGMKSIQVHAAGGFVRALKEVSEQQHQPSKV
jgi:hypothetical protein